MEAHSRLSSQPHRNLTQEDDHLEAILNNFSTFLQIKTVMGFLGLILSLPPHTHMGWRRGREGEKQTDTDIIETEQGEEEREK